jgi:thiol-disulfide isomerase/thioredoxin
MRFKLLIIAAILPVMVSAQTKNFSVSGKIGTLTKPAKVYLDYMDNGVSHEDSTEIVDGTFSFSGHISFIASARMTLDHHGEGKQSAIFRRGDVIYFYFDKDNTVMTSQDSLINATHSGSKLYDEFDAYNKVIGGTIMALTKQANIDFASGTPEQQKDTSYANAVGARFHRRIDERSRKQLQFAIDHPKSFFGLVALSESAGVKVDIQKIEPIYNALDPKLRATDMGVELAQRIKAASITAVGKPAPLFTQNDLNGNPVALASLKGKVVLIDFWASWCHPCRGENPNLKKQYALYKDKGFEILSVSMDSEKKNWVQAMKQDGMPWLNTSDLKGWNNQVGRLYGVRGIPACFLIDADGKIIADDVRGETLNKKLAEIFNK